MKEVIHEECGGVAYLCTDKVYDTLSPVLSEDFFNIDGSQTQVNEIIKCGACGKRVMFKVKKDGSLYATNNSFLY